MYFDVKYWVFWTKIILPENLRQDILFILSCSHESLGKAVSPVVQRWRAGLHGATSPGVLHTLQSPTRAVMGARWEAGAQLTGGSLGPPHGPRAPGATDCH